SVSKVCTGTADPLRLPLAKGERRTRRRGDAWRQNRTKPLCDFSSSTTQADPAAVEPGAASMNAKLVANSARLIVGLLVAAALLATTPSKSDEPAKAEKPAADSMVGEVAGDVRDDNALKMKLVWY